MKSKIEFEPFFVCIPHDDLPYIASKHHTKNLAPDLINGDHYFFNDHELKLVLDCNTFESTLSLLFKSINKIVSLDNTHFWNPIFILVCEELKKQNVFNE